MLILRHWSYWTYCTTRELITDKRQTFTSLSSVFWVRETVTYTRTDQEQMGPFSPHEQPNIRRQMGISKLPNNGAKNCVSCLRPIHLMKKTRTVKKGYWYMFPERLVYVLLRLHQACHFPQGFKTFLLLYCKANFTPGRLLRAVSYKRSVFCINV